MNRPGAGLRLVGQAQALQALQAADQQQALALEPGFVAAFDLHPAIVAGRIHRDVAAWIRAVRALHVEHLHPAHDRDDAAVSHALIAALRAGRAGLVTLLGLVLHKGVAKRLHGQRLAGCGLGCAGVAALAHAGQSRLRHRARLIERWLAVLAQGGLAALARVQRIAVLASS